MLDKILSFLETWWPGLSILILSWVLGILSGHYSGPIVATVAVAGMIFITEKD